MGLPVIVGTVEEDDSPNIDTVLKVLAMRNYKTVHMYPLMIVAGDHDLPPLLCTKLLAVANLAGKFYHFMPAIVNSLRKELVSNCISL